MKKYIMELTDEQYSLIVFCVESVHRISVGQVEELDGIVPVKIDRELFLKLKEQAFPELSFNQSYKWCGGHHRKTFSHFQAATYAIYREMLHARIVNEGVDNVYQSPTLRCDGVDLPKITINEQYATKRRLRDKESWYSKTKRELQYLEEHPEEEEKMIQKGIEELKRIRKEKENKK